MALKIKAILKHINTNIKTLLVGDPDLGSRTKLSPDEICDLISICLSASDIVYDGRHHTQRDSGPIGPSLLVTISQIWMDYTLEIAIQKANARNLAPPRHLVVYMDDCWGLISYPREGLAAPLQPPIQLLHSTSA